MDKLYLGADHAGLEVKQALVEFLQGRGPQVEDLGTYSSERVNYPDFAKRLAQAVAREQARGILVCGSGQGVCMVANKFKGIRAALAWSEEVAALSRQHNDSNVLCLPGRFLSVEVAHKIVDTWLKTDFEGGRHSERIAMFSSWGESSA